MARLARLLVMAFVVSKAVMILLLVVDATVQRETARHAKHARHRASSTGLSVM